MAHMHDLAILRCSRDKEYVLRPTVLQAQANKRSIMEPFVQVKCPDCGYSYVPDHPKDIMLHAKFHEEFTSPDRPIPDPRLAGLVDPTSGLIIFQRTDQNVLHEKLYGIARRFKREMGYDQADWAPIGYQVPPGAIGAIFSDDEGRALGGAGIYTETPFRNVSYMIGWIWIAPDFRRKGVLARALPDLAMRFPGALFQFPYSEAMERFAAGSPFISNEGGPIYLKQPNSQEIGWAL
jgi:zinc-finger of acetyl-transferase ESCO